jgi:hypothetical protein
MSAGFVVLKTESRLPQGYAPGALGQVGNVVGGTLPLTPAPDSHLVSYLTTPIRRGAKNTYVCFITDTGLAGSVKAVEWKVEGILGPGRSTEVVNTDAGLVFEHKFTAAIPVVVSVSLLDSGGTALRKLSMAQDIVAPNGRLEAVFRDTTFETSLGPVESRAALGGHPETTRELVNDLRPYIDAAFNAYDGDAHRVPRALLAAVVYLRALEESQSDRAAQIADAAEEINAPGMNRWISDAMDPTGVCQLPPHLAALVARTAAVGEATYLSWLPGRWAEDATILKDSYKALSEDHRVDLFNLVRFPKSNIRLCYDLLARLKSRADRYPAMSTADFLGNDTANRVLASELELGPTKEGMAADALEKRAFGRSARAVMFAPFLAIDFDGLLRLSGQVRDQSGAAVSGARIDVFATQIEIVQNGLRVFKEPDTASASAPVGREILPVLDVRRSVNADGSFSPGSNDLVKVVFESDVLEANAGWIVARSGATYYGSLVSVPYRNQATTDGDGKFTVVVRELQPYLLRVVSPTGQFFDGESGWQVPPDESLAIEVQKEAGLIPESGITAHLGLFAGFDYRDPLDTTLAAAVAANDTTINLTAAIADLEGSTLLVRRPDAAGGSWNTPPVVSVNTATDVVTFGATAVGHTADLGVRVTGNQLAGYPAAIAFNGQYGIRPALFFGAGDTKRNDCNTFTQAILWHAWLNRAPQPAFNGGDHSTWMIQPADLYGTITVAINRGIAVNARIQGAANVRLLPQPWTLVQAWRSIASLEGHSFIVLDTHERSGRVLILESNVPPLDGPGFRGVGHIDVEQAGGAITPNRDRPWPQKETVKQWQEFFVDAPAPAGKWDPASTHMVRLKVYDLQLARCPVL